jgi:hypothetical protein
VLRVPPVHGLRPVPPLPLVVLLLLTAAPPPSAAQHALEVGGPYDASVPRPSAVLGYELGDRFTPHHLIVRYAEAVARSSGRVRLDTVGHTYEGREVLLVVVTSEANHARMAEIRAGAARLADPRGESAGALDAAVATTPALVWLGYSIHGNEASGVEAALGTLYELAASTDPATRSVLDSVVVLMDPVQNPDGHERHVQDVMRDRGAFGPDPFPGAMVHGAPWPGARTSHYLFDLNRDWFLHSHPVTRARTAAFLEWSPHVAVDLHEMGSSSTYFFAPPMEPLNPNVHASIPKWWDIFARANADALAERGQGFFTGESFDEFYPGYGVSWPVLTGAVGMTYEQASSAGGAIRRDDGSVLTLREAAGNHYATSLATVRATARRRTERVRDYLEFRRTAVTESEGAALRTVILEPDAAGRAAALVNVLRGNGIEVGRLTAPTAVRATPYDGGGAERIRMPSGSWVVDLAQPQGRLARALLEPDAALPEAFVEEELQARREGRSDRFYDITAWSLPFTFGVDAWGTRERVGPVSYDEAPATAPAPPRRAGYAYVFHPHGEASARLLGGLLADSVRVRRASTAFRVGAADFPAGAYVVLANRNEATGGGGSLHDRIVALSRATGAAVTAVDNALVDSGTDLGSNSVRAVPTPRVALAGGPGVNPYSFGAAWHAFDQLLGYPVTRVELEDLSRYLDAFDVVVLPSAFGVDDRLGEAGATALRSWVRGGGTLVTLDAATAWAAREDGISRFRPAEAPAAEDGGRPLQMSVPGAIVRAAVSPLSPLVMGVDDDEIPVMLSGDRVYAAPDDVRPDEVVVRYADADRLRLAGFLWPGVAERVAGSPFLWSERVGGGRLIAFAGDPNFRSLWRGLTPLFANAVLLGPSL